MDRALAWHHRKPFGGFASSLFRCSIASIIRQPAIVTGSITRPLGSPGPDARLTSSLRPPLINRLRIAIDRCIPEYVVESSQQGPSIGGGSFPDSLCPEMQFHNGIRRQGRMTKSRKLSSAGLRQALRYLVQESGVGSPFP